MKPHDAAALLGLSGASARPEIVRAAYAAAVKADHPDHGGDGSRLASLKAARDTLLCQGEVSPCKLCRGMAYVKGRFGVRACTACGGTGDQR